MTTLERFSEQHRLRRDREKSWPLNHPEAARRDRGEFIPGRLGHIYDWEDGVHLAVMVTPGTKQKWNTRRRALEAAGLEVIQNGDDEGCLRFDPTNTTQAKAAITIIRAYRRQQLTPEQRVALGQRLAESRAASLGAILPIENSAVSVEKPVSEPEPSPGLVEG
jgi:hypothetical protein